MTRVDEKQADWSRTGIQAEVPVESPAYARASRRRFDVTLRGIQSLRGPVLDLGPPNALAREMERRYGVNIVHTDAHDLDRERLGAFRPGPYGTITAFEILEHVLNPLFVLDGCREVLLPHGTLHVSVPRRNGCEWVFGKSPEHFHEFAPDELRWLLTKAGFEIEHWDAANSSVLSPGLRPLLRRLLRNLLLVRCRVRGAEAR
jgi:hypothetical protein